MRLQLRFFFLGVLALAAFSVLAWSQGSFGGLTGNITDQSGAVIPDANLKVVNLSTAATYSGTSTAEGVYLISGLPPGRYRLTVTKPGFKTTTREPVEVSTATTTTLNLDLAVGEVTQTVEVIADVVQLQTSSPEIGTVMPEKDMLDLPISLGGAATAGASGRRQIENFIFLTPGVTGSQWSQQINGAPGFSQEILIDGVDMVGSCATRFRATSFQRTGSGRSPSEPLNSYPTQILPVPSSTIMLTAPSNLAPSMRSV